MAPPLCLWMAAQRRDKMEYRRITSAGMDRLWTLHTAYKAAIGENLPSAQDRERLEEAMAQGKILFYGAWDGETLAGCCSVTIGFSTFCYGASGVFEDFYICPAYRHQGIARALVQFARADSGVRSLTVGCAACDVEMYQALGFSVPLGSLLAYD
nr:GNAT family acetyltransferase [uncultured bacterium]